LYTTTLEKGIGLYGGLFHINAYTQIFDFFIFLLSGIILALSSFYPRKIWIKENGSFYNLFFSPEGGRKTSGGVALNNKNIVLNKMSDQFKILEYPLILLFVVAGATFLISTSDLVSIFLSIELQSYGLYLLSTIYRNSELSTKAGLTYFLLGGLSSCIILLGQSLIYANSGNSSIEGLYIINSITDIIKENEISLSNEYTSYYLNFSLIIMSVGFLFKVSAAPFHFWSPDVYDAIPTIVTTFVAIIAKISIFIFFLELIHYTSSSLYFSWNNNLLLSSLFSLIIGTVLGLTQFRIKRLFAYSTISHIGFILLALSINSVESIQAFIFYLMQYSITNLNAFILLLSMGYFYLLFTPGNNEHKSLQDMNNSPIQLITQIKGYYQINPLLALSLGITLFSFLGVPPLIGFFGKQMVLSAALDNGYIFMTILAILTSVISAVYYLAVIKEIFFSKSEFKYLFVEEKENKKEKESKNKEKQGSALAIKESRAVFEQDSLKPSIVLSGHLSITISILTLIIVMFLWIPEEWLTMTSILSLIIFNV
jgi:NADH-ubiquinone oxidoreductase chain 2